jgi:2'-5' RNA ligase
VRRRKRDPGADEGRAVRAFVALEIDRATHQRVGDALSALRPRLPGLRAVRADSMHLTLRFLGWTSAEVLERMLPELRQLAGACPRCEAPVRGPGFFPERGTPRVLWLDVALPAPLLDLQKACERLAVSAGFQPETRSFRSHLTLGRWRERVRRPELPELDLGTASLDTLVLFRSELRRDGAVYTPLARFPLRPEGT